MKPLFLILLGLFVFLGSALFGAPADRVHHWLVADHAPFRALGVGGTAARGNAKLIEIRGHPALEEMSWQLQKLKLLLGRASFKISGGNEDLRLDGTAYAVPSGAISLQDFSLNSPLRKLAAAAGYTFVPAVGTIEADIHKLTLRDQWPHNAEGILTVGNLSWKLGRDPIPLGTYQATLSNQTGGIQADILRLSGDLLVNGEAQINHDKSWEIHLQMKPKNGASPQLRNLMRNVGKPDTQGWYHLRQRGAQPMMSKTELMP